MIEDDEKLFINTRSPYVLFNVGYYLMRKKEYGEKCKTKTSPLKEVE